MRLSSEVVKTCVDLIEKKGARFFLIKIVDGYKKRILSGIIKSDVAVRL